MTSLQQRDAHTVLAAIDELLPRLGERAQETEDLRRLPDANVAELDEAGFFKMLQPEQWGGLQCDPVLFFEAVRRIAGVCGSTGWAGGILGVHNWHLAQFDQQAQQDVWGDDPGVRVSRPTLRWVREWWSTAAIWSTGLGCGPRLRSCLLDLRGRSGDQDGRPVDFGSFLMPLGDYQIRDDWHVVGLKEPVVTP